MEFDGASLNTSRRVRLQVGQEKKELQVGQRNQRRATECDAEPKAVIRSSGRSERRQSSALSISAGRQAEINHVETHETAGVWNVTARKTPIMRRRTNMHTAEKKPWQISVYPVPGGFRFRLEAKPERQREAENVLAQIVEALDK